VWEEPPGTHYHKVPSWESTLAPLMERPGDWARVRELTPNSASTTVGHLHHRRLNYPAGRWEFTSRVRDGRGYIYARYLGPEDGGS
jgi:hypothetical protein